VTWAALSLADKLDSFAALTSAGEKATGSRDPFALRRAVQGAVRVLMDLPELAGITVEISLRRVLQAAAERLAGGGGDVTAVSGEAAAAFVTERVRYALEQRGYPIEVVRAATSDTDLRPLRARRMAEALQGMRHSEDFQGLAILFKRVKNITHSTRPNDDSGARSGQASDGDRAPLDREALTEPAERALLDELDRRRPAVEHAARAADYRKAFTEIAGLRAAVDRFFTEVFVMAEDARLRTARLTLMADLRDLILQFADISEIVPHTE
jgi:glycyl-tRNA synthetase beta chain